MKKILIVLVFISSACIAQEPVFNFEKNKAYKITMKGADDFNKADNIARSSEKMQLAVFSYVDPTTSTGYFIVDNFYKVHEIEKMINNQDGYNYTGYEELQLTEDFFLDIYMKRGGFEPSEFSNQTPKKVQMGPFTELSNSLYTRAKKVWVNKYPESYKALIPPKKELTPEELKEKQIKGY